MRAAHIIIEGPDGAGKTTLAKQLCSEAGYAYRHEGPPPASATALQHYAGILASLTEPTLLDRFHLGELVYGPVVRGGSGLSPDAMGQLHQTLFELNVQVILCLPPFNVAWANWLNRRKLGHEFLTDPSLFCASYLGFSNLKSEADIIYDYTRDVVDIDGFTNLRREPWRVAS